MVPLRSLSRSYPELGSLTEECPTPTSSLLDPSCMLGAIGCVCVCVCEGVSLSVFVFFFRFCVVVVCCRVACGCRGRSGVGSFASRWLSCTCPSGCWLYCTCMVVVHWVGRVCTPLNSIGVPKMLWLPCLFLCLLLALFSAVLCARPCGSGLYAGCLPCACARMLVRPFVACLYVFCGPRCLDLRAACLPPFVVFARPCLSGCLLCPAVPLAWSRVVWPVVGFLTPSLPLSRLFAAPPG